MGTLTTNNAACNIVIYPVEYGLLYNWYAATDSRKISSSDDWVVPTSTQRDTLNTNLGGNTISGKKLKEIGTTYWDTGNTGTNEVGFNGRGGGIRTGSGFTTIKSNGTHMCSNQLNSTTMQGFQLVASSDVNTNKADPKYYGWSIRLLYVGAETPTKYVGNDGKVYRVVLINSQYWLADNLSETRFRNGDIIPWYGANPVDYFTNAEWAALTTSGMCAYNNDVNNVAAGFSFPT